MNEANMKLWEEVKQPPKEALRPILGGRLAGKTDINPQWRYQAITEQFGPCGIGWKVEPVRKWTEPGPEGQVFAFVDVNVYIRLDDGSWSDPIPGTGGSMLIAKESGGLHANDEAFKMADTDAVSVAFKRLGFGADVYFGRWDGSRFSDPVDEGVIADWLAACEEAADSTMEEFKTWWPDHKVDILKACGEAGAARVYAQYMTYLAAKRKVKK